MKEEMKEKFRKVLRIFRVDVLLFALFHKIAQAVTKKLTACKNAVQKFLTRLFPRNGEKVAVETAENVTVTKIADPATDTTVDVTVDTVVDVTLLTDNA